MVQWGRNMWQVYHALYVIVLVSQDWCSCRNYMYMVICFTFNSIVSFVITCDGGPGWCYVWNFTQFRCFRPYIILYFGKSVSTIPMFCFASGNEQTDIFGPFMSGGKTDVLRFFEMSGDPRSRSEINIENTLNPLQHTAVENHPPKISQMHSICK